MALSRTIVSTTWLKAQFPQLPRSLKILDASWTAVKSGRDDYAGAHIPEAQFFDLNECVQPTPTLPRNVPEPRLFREYARSLGVSTDSHVVVYDRGGILPSARTWWTFRMFGHNNISVLDGGLKKWVSEGNPTTSGESSATEQGDFNVTMNYDLVNNLEKVVRIIKEKQTQIVDARQPDHFSGAGEEPTNFTKKALEGMQQPMPSGMRAGHLPGAVNLLEDFVLNSDTKCLLPENQLRELFVNRGIDLQKSIATMCYNGHAACLLSLAMAICGKTDASVYYGSWTEYGQKGPENLIEKATKPVAAA